MSGFVLWRGASLLDGAPIVAIAISARQRYANRKTGHVLQTYILRDDVDPVSAARTGADASVCGDCKHRPALGGACYVTLIHGPASVYRTLARGAYPSVSKLSRWPSEESARSIADGIATLGQGRPVRLGTYGDPAAVPVEIWETLTMHATARMGYSHQWANGSLSADHRARLARLCMASVDDAREAERARAMGLRYFRIRTQDEPIGEREIVCPASAEAGKVRTCATCKACSGTARPGQASIVIIVHGAKASRFSQSALFRA